MWRTIAHLLVSFLHKIFDHSNKSYHLSEKNEFWPVWAIEISLYPSYVVPIRPLNLYTLFAHETTRPVEPNLYWISSLVYYQKNIGWVRSKQIWPKIKYKDKCITVLSSFLETATENLNVVEMFRISRSTCRFNMTKNDKVIALKYHLKSIKYSVWKRNYTKH